MRLTDRILASGVSLTDLIHIVITGDTTQSPEGSSYKASISQVKSLFGDAIIITGTGVTSSIRKDSGNLASGNFSSSIPGSGNTSSGHLSYSEGENTISSGRTSHSEGSNTTAGGNNSHAEGEWTRALGVSSHAEGNTTYSIGNYSHSEGFETIARGISSHAQGDSTSAYGDYSHAGGLSSTVSGNTSFVHSKDSAVYSDYSSVLGGRNNDIINNSIDIGNNVILGGDTNIINGHNYSTIINGTGNTIHFDLIEYANFNSFEMITNSKDSKISGSSNCEISSNVGGWIIGGQSSVMMGCIDGNYSSSDPNDSNCGIFKDNTSSDFGIHLLLNSYDSIIRNNGIQNTIIGSQLSRISGSTNSSFRNNFIGGSSQVFINNRVDSYYNSLFNSVIGSGRISLDGANNYTSVFGSYDINMNNTQQCFIGASNESNIYSGETSAIVGGKFHNILGVENSGIFGGSGNTISGLTVSSGSSNNTAIIAGYNNLISNQTIDSGLGSLNGIGESINSTILGGQFNNIFGHKNSAIIGGSGNTIHFDVPIVYNDSESIITSTDCGITASTTSSILSSSGSSVIYSNQSSIIGGYDNHLAFTNQSSILFGYNNNVGNVGFTSTENSHIFGGYDNTVYYSTNSGLFLTHNSNNTNSINSGVFGGKYNNIDASYDSVILGGEYNTITGAGTTNFDSVILGGSGNTINNHDYASIIGGVGNTIDYDSTGTEAKIGEVIIGGWFNSISASSYSTILGGFENVINNYTASSIIGGKGNKFLDYTDDTFTSAEDGPNDVSDVTMYSSILGGVDNVMSGKVSHSSIIGGSGNTINGNISSIATYNSAIIGGKNNTIDINTSRSIILGGSGITANTSDMVYTPDLIVNGLINVTDLQTNSNGQLVDGTSDARLKQNINELTNSLDIINNLRGVSFEYTPESKMGDGIRYGFIAQEVQQYVPDIVRSRAKGDGMLSLNYNEIVPILVESVKELSSKLTLTIPVFTPTSSNDTTGNEGEITRDENYMYVKTNSGWKRSSLEQF